VADVCPEAGIAVMLKLVFLMAGALLGAAAFMSQRGYRTCICCRPRKRFPSVAERRWHEQIGHSL
jgi:hypothetical protein